MHIHVLMLSILFELIPIKIEFLKLFKKISTIVFSQILSNITRREFSIFITFCDAYTYSYVV